MTLSRLRASSPAEAKRRAGYVSLLMLNPYFFTARLSLCRAWRRLSGSAGMGCGRGSSG